MKKPPKLLTCTALVLTVGCTTMQPTAAPRETEQGTAVRVHLVEGQDVELASLTVRNVRVIEGVLTGWSSSDEALILSRRVTTGGGVIQETQSETLRVPQPNIETMEVEAPDKGRTTVLAVVGGALVVGVLVLIGARGNSGGSGPPDPPPPPTRTGPAIPFGIR